MKYIRNLTVHSTMSYCVIRLGSEHGPGFNFGVFLTAHILP